MSAGDVETFRRAGKWFNRIEGERFAAGPYPTRADAEAAGRVESRRWGTDHLVRDENGRITASDSYGHGPYPARG